MSLSPEVGECGGIATRARFFFSAVLAGLCFTGCGKDSKTTGDVPIETVSSGADGTVITTHLLGEASKLGFAAKVPSDVVLFVSALNVKAHLSHLEDTRYYQDVSAYLDDKTPVPSADEPSKTSALTPMLGDDAFLAIGAGGDQFIGAAARMAEADSSGVVTRLLSSVLPLPGLVGQKVASGGSAANAPGFGIPPVLIGIRSNDPAKALATLLPEATRLHLAKLGKGAEMTLADGSRFTLHEGKLGTLLEDQSSSSGWARLLLAAKDQPCSAAWGISGDYALLALGAARKALEFASRPEESVLAKNEWAFLNDQVNDSLIGLGWIDQNVLELSSSRLRPAKLLQTWLHTLPADSPFSGLDEVLKGHLKALAESESRWLDNSWSPAAFGAWWQSGLRVEIFGGPVQENEMDMPGFKFTGQMNEASVLYGLNTFVQTAAQTRFQLWLKDWGTLLHAGTTHVLKQNATAAGGEENPLQKWLDSEVVPNVSAVHEGLLQVTSEGLGIERAWLVELPESATDGVSPEQTAQVPHFAQLAAVNDRRAVGRGWLTMETPLSHLTRSIPSGLPPDSFVPEMVVQDGMHLYYLSLPFTSPQFSPCLALGDEAMVVSSSRLLADRITSSLQKVKSIPSESTISQWRINVPLLRKWLQGGATATPPVTAASAAAHWMTPFGELRGRSLIKGGKLHRVWTWDITDPRRFD